jgi:plasmid stabilization system protein ParE
LIVLTPRAGRQVRELRRHYDKLERPEAINGLVNAIEAAWEIIVTNPAAGIPAPRPYPQLARQGVAWVKAGRYWVAYRTVPRPIIAAVFFETANIPSRL